MILRIFSSRSTKPQKIVGWHFVRFSAKAQTFHYHVSLLSRCLGTRGAFTPSTFPRNSSRNFSPELSSKSRSHQNKSLREDYANEAADVTSSSSALGLLAGRKKLHGVYCHPKSRVNRQKRRHLLITPPLPRLILCCHKLVSLRWCAGLMLIMLMQGNQMAASQKLFRVWRGVVCNSPGQSEIGTFFSPGKSLLSRRD